MFELASVVDMVPDLPDGFKGKVSWVKVGPHIRVVAA